ncbi:MAG TPA: efflux RND transporter periplasmic adaptor subunit [Geobacteraceae bacterium]
MKKKIIVAAVIVIALAAIAGLVIPRKPPLSDYRTVKVERGEIVSSVSATGTLTAVVTVQVGTQVSGTISKLFVDFNSKVKKGQVIAQIDPALFIAKVEETRGIYLNAQANLEKAKADLVDAKRTLERNRQLVGDGIIAQSDFDTAETRYQQAVAAVKAAEGGVSQNRGTYSQAKTNLEYATIKSPVDGIVVSRNVDVGQTVAASFQTPTLFTIAQDLTKMEIDTSVDEADISRVQVGQPVSFSVDSYPDAHFTGKVTQIRNAPIINQNVVTYIVVIGVDNKELKLKPGMTANVTIETARKDNVLKIPSAALRFKPKAEKESKSKDAGGSGRPTKREPSQVVYILGPEGTPTPVPVTTGVTNSGQVELASGNIKENDEVIVEQLTAKKKKDEGMGGGMPRGPGM